MKKKTSSAVIAAAVSGLLLGSSVTVTSCSTGSDKTSESVAAKVVPEKHACKGMNTCKGKGADGKNECAKKGSCATVAHHSCGGNNTCKGLGGCKTDKHDCAGKNDCKGKGVCHVPVKH